jgi:hypothetical protein
VANQKPNKNQKRECKNDEFKGVMTKHRFLAAIFNLSAILKQSKIKLGS